VSYATARSVIALTVAWIEKEQQVRHAIETLRKSGQRQRSLDRLQRDLERAIDGRRERGVFAICTSEIRRTAQGFGNFGPSLVRS
jgi:hypothetical protein